MMWLSGRQFRAPALVAAAFLAAIAVFFALTGGHVAHLYHLSVTCQANDNCPVVGDLFGNNAHYLQWLSTILVAVPGLIGLFWGAPLVARELETGTWRLAWTQSVTRQRWLAFKLAAVGAATIAFTGLFSLLLTWWGSPIDRVKLDRFSPALFSERGVVPIGYAAFAFAFGVIAGVLIRRTLPAMAVTLVAYIAARQTVTYLVRPHFEAPLHTTSLFQANDLSGPAPGAWVVSTKTVDAAGHLVNPAKTVCHLPGGSGTSANPVVQACQDQVRAYVSGLHNITTYQPASRFWTFQGYETAIFVAAALVLVGACFWCIRHRLS
jgi:ABC-type transport system involved in multi-copper enzyme maturation permease subunit